MPSGSFSKRARNSDSLMNKKNCGGNKKAGLAPRATGPTEFRNVAFNIWPTVNFKISKGNLPCPENYRNNPGGQCSGGVGALASTRNRGCTYSHSNVRSGGKSSGFSCPPASLDAYVGRWRISRAEDTNTYTVNISDLDQNFLKQFEELTNTKIVGDAFVTSSSSGGGLVFLKLRVPGERCDKIYTYSDGNGDESILIPANPVEFSYTFDDGYTATFTKL